MLSAVAKPGRQTKVVTGSVVTPRAEHSFHSFRTRGQAMASSSPIDPWMT